jgi:prefoldin subunit 5
MTTNEDIILPNKEWASEIDKLNHTNKALRAEIRTLNSQIAMCERKLEDLRKHIVLLSKDEK